MLPLSPGRAESHSFEDERNGSLSPFAALNTATGEVIGETAPRHTSEQFVAFAARAKRGGLSARIEDAAVKQQLLEYTHRAFDRGAFGSPTFFVGNEMYFGKDQLRDVEEEIERVMAVSGEERTP